MTSKTQATAKNINNKTSNAKKQIKDSQDFSLKNYKIVLTERS